MQQVCTSTINNKSKLWIVVFTHFYSSLLKLTRSSSRTLDNQQQYSELSSSVGFFPRLPSSFAKCSMGIWGRSDLCCFCGYFIETADYSFTIQNTYFDITHETKDTSLSVFVIHTVFNQNWRWEWFGYYLANSF